MSEEEKRRRFRSSGKPGGVGRSGSETSWKFHAVFLWIFHFFVATGSGSLIFSGFIS